MPHRKGPSAPRILTHGQRIRPVRGARRGLRARSFEASTWSHRPAYKHAAKKFGVKIAYMTLVSSLREPDAAIRSSGGS